MTLRSVANVVTNFTSAGIYVGDSSVSTALNSTVIGGSRIGRCIQSDSFSTFINNVRAKCQRSIAYGESR